MALSSYHTKLMENYDKQLTPRFYSNSMALEVLFCLILISIFIIHIAKFFKKTYEWTTEHEVNLDQLHQDMEETGEYLKEISEIDSKEQASTISTKLKKEALHQLCKQPKKEAVQPTLIAIQNIVRNKMPQLAILVVNVVMIASFEYVAITAYICVVIIVVGEVLAIKESEHLNLRFVLDIVGKGLMLTWYINLFTVPRPDIFKTDA